MKNILLLVSVLTLMFTFAAEVEAASSMATSHPHALSTEILGRAGLYSLNYDYMLNDKIAVGAGVATYSLNTTTDKVSTLVIPLYANYYFLGEGSHRLFGTAGLDFVFASAKTEGDGVIKGSGVAGVIGGGYEYRSDAGLLFRFTPYVFVGKASGAWLGFSVGYSI